MAGSTGWGFCLTAKKQLFPTFKSGLQSTAVPPCLGVPVALQAGGRENCMDVPTKVCGRAAHGTIGARRRVWVTGC